MSSGKALRFVGYVLVVYGLFEVFEKVWDLAQGTPPDRQTALAAIGALVVAAILLRFLPRLLRSPLLRRLGVQPRSYIIDRNSEYVVEVQDESRAIVTAERDYVFLERPERDDLADLCLSSRRIDVAKLEYRSKDANVTSNRLHRGCNVAVYWEPRSNVQPLGPYQHGYSWTLRSNLVEARNYWQYKPVVRTGRHQVTVECARAPIGATAFCRPRLRRMKGEQAVYRYADRDDVDFHCPPPETHGNTIVWTMLNPEVGRDYYIVWKHGCDYVDPDSGQGCGAVAVHSEPELRCEDHFGKQ